MLRLSSCRELKPTPVIFVSRRLSSAFSRKGSLRLNNPRLYSSKPCKGHYFLWWPNLFWSSPPLSSFQSYGPATRLALHHTLQCVLYPEDPQMLMPKTATPLFAIQCHLQGWSASYRSLSGFGRWKSGKKMLWMTAMLIRNPPKYDLSSTKATLSLDAHVGVLSFWVWPPWLGFCLTVWSRPGLPDSITPVQWCLCTFRAPVTWGKAWRRLGAGGQEGGND